MPETGVAFSGGGIRSAALCSGVLRRLLQRGVEPDYLSCVSGGGYTGTAYLDWKYRHEKNEDTSWHNRFFEHMRNGVGLLCDWKRPMHGILDSMIIIGLLLLVSVITPFIMWACYACPLAFLIDIVFGDILRAVELRCSDQFNAAAVTGGPPCVARAGAKANRSILFVVPLIVFLGSYILAKMTTKNTGLLRLVTASSGLTFALTFFPWFIHVFLGHTPFSVQIAAVFIVIIMWYFAPVFRRRAAFALIVYSFAYVVYWRVYAGDIGGFQYTEQRFFVSLFSSGVMTSFISVFGAFQQRLVHVYYRWRLQKAFFTEQSVGSCGCAGIGCQEIFPGMHLCTAAEMVEGLPAGGPLSLDDLKDMKPKYIANTVVNDWSCTRQDELRYNLLTLSPTEIERIDCQPQFDEFCGKMTPKDIKLSDAMTTSAAAVSYDMGSYRESTPDAFQHILTILGLGMGASRVSDVAREREGGFCLKVLPYLVEIVRVAPLVVFPAVYLVGAGGSVFVTIGIFVYFAFLLLLTAAAVISTGDENPGLLDRIVRWLIVHVPYCRFVHDIFNILHIGFDPPPVLRLTDGGHFENLGLLPLLKRRLHKIVVINGGHTDPDAAYGDILVRALEQARTKLHCSFKSMAGRDVIEDIKHNFVMKAPGQQPRSYKFRVDYYEKEHSTSKDRKVGEGEVILIAPRHPNKGIKNTDRVTWKEALRDIGVDLAVDLWGPGPELEAAEVDRLTFCCCECCHDSWARTISNLLCGEFPHHKTAHQFFTPDMFSAYHREGYHACVEAEAVEFLGVAKERELYIPYVSAI